MEEHWSFAYFLQESSEVKQSSLQKKQKQKKQNNNNNNKQNKQTNKKSEVQNTAFFPSGTAPLSKNAVSNSVIMSNVEIAVCKDWVRWLLYHLGVR